MAYLNSAINSSPVIALLAGTVLTAPAMLALGYDADGNAVLPTAGGVVAGIAAADTGDIKKGDCVTVANKDTVLWIAGEAVKAGDELACNAEGKAVKATAGQFIVGIAVSIAEAGNPCYAHIVNAGYKA